MIIMMTVMMIIVTYDDDDDYDVVCDAYKISFIICQ